jgi:hypothetical protein
MNTYTDTPTEQEVRGILLRRAARWLALAETYNQDADGDWADDRIVRHHVRVVNMILKAVLADGAEALALSDPVTFQARVRAMSGDI